MIREKKRKQRWCVPSEGEARCVSLLSSEIFCKEGLRWPDASQMLSDCGVIL